ncbi:MAG: tripartite tricarboxylate transporter substrate binding protein [Deltaproteobacteria bacterium]|nr:tripartite tricarboxylate transporter substrate binding protein [Deltaproteobacteria bacterium]
MKINIKLIVLLFLCLVFLNGSMAFADEYPTKPVKLIVPWGAGGGTDALMRVVAHFATKYLGQPMVVVNVPGVGGTLGARQGKDAKPDGYTLTATHESVISSKIVGVSDFDYSDFIPIANMTLTPAMVAAQPEAPWNDMKELIADAKKRPGEIKFGATLGSTSHFFPLDIANQCGIEFKIVGYEGTAKRQAALLGGFIDLGESNPAAGKKYFEAKKLKPLGIATEKRHEILPDVPTLREQGVNVLFAVNRGICAPLKTPQPVIDELGAVLAKVSKDPEFIAKIASLGSDVKYRDQAGYQTYIEAETNRLDMLAEKFNVQAKKK